MWIGLWNKMIKKWSSFGHFKLFSKKKYRVFQMVIQYIIIYEMTNATGIVLQILKLEP